ncbi:MAG TPA: large conductance mechanosensitive channel protein MscL [Candidatus Saccharimonadales bacterium]|nr:large conductance mechanosensitive channel protein MscL [Candidatus Saccharimonadales bacterium]
MLKDFQKFILRGNVVDLAVAVVIGAAFNAVIQALVKDFITPLITGFFGKGALFKGELIIAKHFIFNWGNFLSVVISFILEAFIIFIFIVKPINKLVELSKRGETPQDPATKKCPQCCSDIPLKAVRCAFCTSKVSL